MEDAVVPLSSSRNVRIDSRSKRRQEQEVNARTQVSYVCLLGRWEASRGNREKVSEVIFTGCREQLSTKWPHTKDMLLQSSPLSSRECRAEIDKLHYEG